MIYDVKMNLIRKENLVTGGYLYDEVSAYMSYSFIVERYSVRIGFMIDGMNYLDVLAADVRSAYLNSKRRKSTDVKIGPELFGIEYEGRYTSIVRVLYDLRSSAVA